METTKKTLCNKCKEAFEYKASDIKLKGILTRRQSHSRDLAYFTSSCSKKVFAIVDNSSTHHGLLLRGWKEKRKHSITIFYLPAYVPHLNPVEYLNNNFKRDITFTISAVFDIFSIM